MIGVSGTDTQDTSQEFYKRVTATDLTPEELRASRFPDDSVVTVWAEITSEAGRRYEVKHFPTHEKGPHILLYRPDDENIQDFYNVEKIVSKVTKGKIGKLHKKGKNHSLRRYCAQGKTDTKNNCRFC
jgi:hypothetical protein